MTCIFAHPASARPAPEKRKTSSYSKHVPRHPNPGGLVAMHGGFRRVISRRQALYRRAQPADWQKCDGLSLGCSARSHPPGARSAWFASGRELPK